MRIRESLVSSLAVLGMATLLALLVPPRAAADPSYFDAQCAACHSNDTRTCSGCHLHVTGGLTATTDKVQYLPSEAVTVTFNSWGWPGWVRAILRDELGTEVDRVTGPTFMGDDDCPPEATDRYCSNGAPCTDDSDCPFGLCLCDPPDGDPTLQLPVVLSAPAPGATGFYTWEVAWFGSTGGSFPPPHTSSAVSTNQFEVTTSPSTTTTTVIGPTTTTTTVVGPTTTTTTVVTPTTTTTTTTLTTPHHNGANGDRTQPWTNCVLCHGPDLMGGIGPSCYDCHNDFSPPDPPAPGHHMPGREDPYANCTSCHGADLMGGIGPSCYTCHGELWPVATTTTTTVPGTTSTTTTVVTPTTTTTTTTLPPAEGLDHFLCYKGSVKNEISVTLDDQFDSGGTYLGKKASMLCTPAVKNDEAAAPADPATHLMSYKVKGSHVARSGVVVTNQFGTYLYDTKKTDSLMVPTAKSLLPAPPPGQPSPGSLVDHYRCLKAKITKGTPKFPTDLSVKLDDQFGTRTFFVKKPSRLCVPTDKNGEGIKDQAAHLVCYKGKTSVRTSKMDVQVNNQLLGAATMVDLKREAELCVPSEKGEVVVDVTITGTPVPGAALAAKATITIGNGSTVQSILWEQVNNSVTVGIDNPTSATATINLPIEGAYKDELFTLLAEPPIEVEEAYHGGLQDRFYLVGLAPLVLEEVGVVTVQVTVTTTSGTYVEEATIHTELPWKTTTGVRDVPVGIPVLLHGKDKDVAGPYDWALSKPGGSTASLVDPTSQNPDFTPDVAGPYTVTVTDTNPEPDEVVTIEIHAGTWAGAITGQDGAGLPLTDGCSTCHNDSFAPDMFTPWRETGHAEIFSTNLDTSTHYSSNCFPCHTVGYDPDVANNGMDDAADYGAFLAAGLLNHPGDNWTTMLASYPLSAKLANIQCENCHGPNDSGAHAQGDPRISLSSDVCGSCHGEPPRHGRFQQWQVSGHANYELAIDESGSGDCSRCHTGNGFLAWEALGNDAGSTVTVAWTEDEAHPQTCVTCHDPHAIGTTSGETGNATVRISGDTPELMAGFTATDVGKGAICMTCHNSRRGLRNDSVFAALSVSDRSRAPHAPAQTDILMGQNAYLVTVGTRGSHGDTANVEQTCVTCHMEATPPPADLSYNLGGTNHRFTASPEICSECHGFGAGAVQPAVDTKLHQLQGLIEDAILDVMADQIALGNHINLGGTNPEITDTAQVADIEFTESRGRQAIIITFTDTTVVTAGMNSINVHDSLNALVGNFYAPTISPEALVKSGWNYGIVHNDLSRGVHNPAFVFGVLDASIAALQAL